jgi:hypothetical protein
MSSKFYAFIFISQKFFIFGVKKLLTGELPEPFLKLLLLFGQIVQL